MCGSATLHMCGSVMCSIIKKEEFRRSFYNTEAELQTAVKEYIEYFNDYRPHQRMGFQTPNQVERDFYNGLQDNKMPTVNGLSENYCPIYYRHSRWWSIGDSNP